MSLDFPWLSKYWSDHPNNSFVSYRFFQITLISVNVKNWPLAKPHRAPSRESVTNLEEGLVSFPAVVRVGLHAEARAHKMWLKHLQGGRKKKENSQILHAWVTLCLKCIYAYYLFMFSDLPICRKGQALSTVSEVSNKVWERPKSLCPKSSLGHCDTARLRHVKEFPTRLK